MCTVVILRRPDDPWPLLLAANRDEMRDRPWQGPARHWPDRAHVTGGFDTLAGGTWMGVNDDGLVACVLNRMNTLGPDPDKRSRGELPLEALDHAEAAIAAEALSHIDPAAYRPFNLLVADALTAWWLRNDGNRVERFEIEPGMSMITAHDLNDTAGSARIRKHLPRFRAAPVPVPDADDGAGDWFGWAALMADGSGERDETMCVDLDTGFGTVSSSLVAIAAPQHPPRPPIWLFADGSPDKASYQQVFTI